MRSSSEVAALAGCGAADVAGWCVTRAAEAVVAGCVDAGLAEGTDAVDAGAGVTRVAGEALGDGAAAPADDRNNHRAKAAQLATPTKRSFARIES